jgi:hypothetical protein
MKTYKLSLTMLLLTFTLACGGKGGGSAQTGAPGPDSPTSPSCKSIYSVWHSSSGFETWDFRGFESSITQTNYRFIADNNQLCGPIENSTQTSTAELHTVTTSTDYQFYWTMLTNYPSSGPAGTCGDYISPMATPAGKRYYMEIKVGCDEIEICGWVGCKTLH